jgi:hypothetical protein
VLGDRKIETQHLLLGLLKDQDDLVTNLLATRDVTGDAIRHLIYERLGKSKAPIETSIEIPFSTDAKQVLQYAFEEANILLHAHIGLEHLLLGLLRVERGLAWDTLREKGFALAPVRDALVMHVSATSPLPGELAGILAAIVPGAAPRPGRPGPVYMMTALDGPSPGRRPAGDVGGFTNVGFSTRADHSPDGQAHSIGPISMAGATLPQLALVLEGFLGAPVMVEDNGMSSVFDIELRGAYRDSDTLIAAVREQLGLELTRSL